MIKFKRRNSYPGIQADVKNAFVDLENNIATLAIELDVKKRPQWLPRTLQNMETFYATPGDLIVCMAGAANATILLPLLSAGSRGLEIAVIAQEAVPVVRALQSTINGAVIHNPTLARRTVYTAGAEKWYTDV